MSGLSEQLHLRSINFDLEWADDAPSTRRRHTSLHRVAVNPLKVKTSALRFDIGVRSRRGPPPHLSPPRGERWP